MLLVCVLSMLDFSETSAQGLSLSFNLTMTDTLANMIADSKKYDIVSLTLVGVVNEENVVYIKDLIKNGHLKNMDISGATHVCANYQFSEYVQFHPKYHHEDKYGTNWEDALNYLYEKGWRNFDWDGWEYNPSFPYDVYVTDTYKDNWIIRDMMIGFEAYHSGGWNRYVRFSKTVYVPYSVETPNLCFQDYSFSKFVIPNNLKSLGGSDCRFRVKSCDEYVLGDQVNEIGENAFRNSHIGTLTLNSTIESINTNAFENATGNVLADPRILEQPNYIGEGAFRNSKLLESTIGGAALRASIIGMSAFQNASVPISISMPNIEYLGDGAFMGSSINKIEIGDKLNYIGDYTFANCYDLQTFCGGVNIMSIGNGAFSGCKQLKAFTPSNALISIGQEAFANNIALSSFSVPDATTYIYYNAFANSGLRQLQLGNYCDYRHDIILGCNNLENISVSSSNQRLKSEDGVLLSKNGTKLLVYPCAKEGAVYDIDNKVEEVGDSAFYGVNKLSSLTISESVNKIGKDAFANSSIIEVKALPTITPKVTANTSGLNQSLVRLFVHEKDYSTYYIANYWGDFKNIFVLEHVVPPGNIIHVENAGTLPEYIGFGDQYNYNSSLQLAGYLNGDDIRYLREMSGRDVHGNPTSGILTDLDFSQASIVKGGGKYYNTIGTNDNVIGESMFEGCNLTSLAISETVTKIGGNALYGCSLTTFRVPAAIQEVNPNSFFGMNTLEKIIVDSDNSSYQSIDGVLFTKDGKTLLLYPYAKPGKQYSIPTTVTYIGKQAFGGSTLKAVIANEGLTNIGDYAFDNLWSLEDISLPSTLGLIGVCAFLNCSHLMSVSCKAYYPPYLYSNGYNYDNFSDETYENAVLYVPQENDGYYYYNGWERFKKIIESDNWIVTGIQNINSTNKGNVREWYDLHGRLMNNPKHGVNIIRKEDGTTLKVFVK